ncbi:MAG: DUF1257 domain-containing protein [Planctomycetes bacterium]|nr:DUF1257 domain-containing protein [Planctomycetota bacterium]
MSHTVTIETQIRDLVALRAACRRAGLEQPQQETVQLFSGQATGYCVRLPQWRYPVVCDPQNGTIHFDNYGGRWGEQRQLDRLMQAYATEKTLFEAHKQGYAATEQTLSDGRIKLTIHVGEEL